TPLELRELDHSPNVEVIVNPEDIEYDDGSVEAINSDNQTKLVVRELERYAMRTAEHGLGSRPRKLFLHFFESPVEVYGDGRVEGFRTERTELTGDGNVRGTGAFKDWPVQAVYRCVGYRSTELPGLPWDARNHVVPHALGRVLDIDGNHLTGIYVNGWVKRGPVGLIGHTKGDAIETVKSLLEDLPTTPPAAEPGEDAVVEFLEGRGIRYTTWDGWYRLDAHEKSLGEAFGPVVGKDGEPGPRLRVKVVDKESMTAISRAE
ncbi:MAG: ferredoxin/flavodoxin---NADP+ reductase, partial [Frankiales bacterium]|nr:ferredoxin/flavodoxin---NADP+ reductase [Frankiales bacterium]